MAKLQISHILKTSSRGQSVVEYILLLAVLSSLSFSLFNNRRFKEFLGGDKGFFLTLRKGIEYSYRYGRPLSPDVDTDAALSFEYQNNKHDTYFNPKENKSRFFGGINAYPP